MVEITLIRGALTLQASEAQDGKITVGEDMQPQDLVIAIKGIPDEVKEIVNEIEKFTCMMLAAFGPFVIRDQVEGTDCTLKLTLEREATE